MLFSELAERYAPVFAAYASPDKYAHNRKVWTAQLDGLAADDVTAGHLEPYLTRRKLDGLSPKTISHELCYVRTLYKWAIRDRLLSYNPAAELRIYVPPNERTRWLTDDEEARLRAVFTPHLWGRVEFALLTGLRSNEQWKMHRDDIDWGKGLLHVVNQKGGGSRTIPLCRRAQEIIREELASHDSEWVWPSGFGGHPPKTPWYSKSAACHMLTKACRRAGIAHCNWHALRHTFATRLVRLGQDIRTIADLLGHRSIQMTMRYLKADPARARSAVEELSASRADMPPVVQVPRPKKKTRPPSKRAGIRWSVEIAMEHGKFDAAADNGTNVHVYLEDGVVKSRLVTGRGGWPDLWLYRGRPLGSLERVWSYLVSRDGQRELGRVCKAIERVKSTRTLDRLRDNLSRTSVEGVEFEPFLRGETTCPNGWTNRELWESLSPVEQAEWEKRLYG